MIQYGKHFYKSVNKKKTTIRPIILLEDLEGSRLTKYIVDKRKKYNKYLKQMAEVMEFPESINDMTSYCSSPFRHDLIFTNQVN